MKRKQNKRITKKIKLRVYILSATACFGFISLVISDFGLRELLVLRQKKQNLNLKIQDLLTQQVSLQEQINLALDVAASELYSKKDKTYYLNAINHSSLELIQYYQKLC